MPGGLAGDELPAPEPGGHEPLQRAVLALDDERDAGRHEAEQDEVHHHAGRAEDEPARRLVGGRAGLDDLAPAAGAASACATMGRALAARRPRPHPGPGRLRTRLPDGLGGGPGRQLHASPAPRPGCGSRWRRGGAARTLRGDDRQSGLVAVGDRGAVALRDHEPRGCPLVRHQLLERRAPAWPTTRTTVDSLEAGHESLRGRAAVGVPHRQRQLLGAAAGAEEEPKNSVNASGMTRMKMNDSRSRTVCWRSLRARSGEPASRESPPHAQHGDEEECHGEPERHQHLPADVRRRRRPAWSCPSRAAASRWG